MLKTVLVFAVILQSSFLAAADGAFDVGFRKIDVISQETDEKFPMAVVYPTRDPAESISFGPFKMKLSMYGKIADGMFPVAIISHGSGGSDLGYRSIAFNLVQQGFIVAMPLHPKNNYKDNTAEGTVRNWVNRPKHIKAAIDTLLSHPKLSASIDNNKIAVVGHSAGGYTALATAGGVANIDTIAELCKNNLQLDEPFCQMGTEALAKSVKISNQADKRVKAIVMMAPVGILFKSEGSLAQVDIPALLLRAEKDGVLTEPYHSEVIAGHYQNKKNLTYRTVSNAGHYSFITPVPDVLKRELGAVAEDPEGFDRAEFHDTLGPEIARYLISVLH